MFTKIPLYVIKLEYFSSLEEISLTSAFTIQSIQSPQKTIKTDVACVFHEASRAHLDFIEN